MAEMEAAGVSPDVVTYTSLLKLQRGEGLGRTWATMSAAGVAPDPVTFSIMPGAMVRRMEPGKAAMDLLGRVLDSLQPRHIDGFVISAAASAITTLVPRGNGRQLRVLDALIALAPKGTQEELARFPWKRVGRLLGAAAGGEAAACGEYLRRAGPRATAGAGRGGGAKAGGGGGRARGSSPPGGPRRGA